MAEKIYTFVATNDELNFDTDTLDLAEGNHTFVVKAKASGYLDSDYSNEVTVSVVQPGYSISVRSYEDGFDEDQAASDCKVYADDAYIGTLDEFAGTTFHATRRVSFILTDREWAQVCYSMGGGNTVFLDIGNANKEGVDLTGDMIITDFVK